ncbi:MAG TPA: hypothetical protein VK550_07470 [Polyangiaceae bacterium]|nr:hypothetical protein [Polyangiaceae bacterium]
MSPQCSEPDLQLSVLNVARNVETATPEVALHLEQCVACQSAAERMRRMVAVWTDDQADDDEIASAAVRFHARSAPKRTAPGWFDVVPFASAGMAAGYLLLAASGTISLPWKSRAVEALPPAAAPAHVAAVPSRVATDVPSVAPVFATNDENVSRVRARPHVETARGVAPLVNGLRLQLKRGESARVALSLGQESHVEGPCLVEFWSTPMEAGGWRMVREETDVSAEDGTAQPAGSNVATPRPVVPPVSGSSGSGASTDTTSARELAGPGATLVSARAWSRAAAALREDNFEVADRAFDELGHSSDPATRDAARLARAQLWISRGREVAVRPVLEQLAANGATALVRQRAAEFLNRK